MWKWCEAVHRLIITFLKILWPVRPIISFVSFYFVQYCGRKPPGLTIFSYFRMKKKSIEIHCALFRTSNKIDMPYSIDNLFGEVDLTFSNSLPNKYAMLEIFWSSSISWSIQSHLYLKNSFLWAKNRKSSI